MHAHECAEQIVSKIAPQLSELGVEAFVLTAYLKTTDAEGRESVERYVIVNGGNNIPMQDGLRPMVIMAGRWKDGQL